MNNINNKNNSAKARAGSLMSCDALVTFKMGIPCDHIIIPGDSKTKPLKFVFDNISIYMEGESIKRYSQSAAASVLDVLEKNNVKEATVEIFDRGALDFVLRARLQCAIDRAMKKSI
jgi:citrate lyase acyl carrier protein